MDDLRLNFTNGPAGTFTCDFIQQLSRNRALHQAYLQRKKDAVDANSSLKEAMAGVKLTGGNLFKCRHTSLDSEVLELRREAESRKRSASASAVMKKVELFTGYLDKYDKLLTSGKDSANYNGTELKVWCDVRRKKADGKLPSRKALLITFAQSLQAKGREPMSLKEYLVDQGYDEELVTSILDDPVNALVQDDNNDEDDDDDDEEMIRQVKRCLA